MTHAISILVNTHVISILVSIGALIWSFFQPIWAWLPLAVVALYLLFVLSSLKFETETWPHVKELSPSANKLLQQFGHFYSMPYMGTIFSGSCSAIQFGAVAVGAVGAFNGFWWGLGIAASFWFILGPVAMAYNPTNFIQNQPGMLAAHEEVISWVSGKQR